MANMTVASEMQGLNLEFSAAILPKWLNPSDLAGPVTPLLFEPYQLSGLNCTLIELVIKTSSQR